MPKPDSLGMEGLASQGIRNPRPSGRGGSQNWCRYANICKHSKELIMDWTLAFILGSCLAMAMYVGWKNTRPESDETNKAKTDL
jgi:hypothetical protein